jgi:twitching motility protein PilU
VEPIVPYLEEMLRRGASDVYLTAGSPPVYRIEGVAIPSDGAPLGPDDTEALAAAVMTERQRREFEEAKEMNLALELGRRARFRCNVFRQRGAVGLVIREIKLSVPSLEELGLPPIVRELALAPRGLVLVVGATGSGKSTTLAAMIDHRNSTTPGHIVTIEDPIEYLHPHKRSIVTQREVGLDTLSFHHALRNALRQAPDAILIGEVRDAETMEAAIAFAETGHLCLATLHSNNAHQAIERILNFFPQQRHPEIYLQLSLNLRAILSQRLIPSKTGRRVAAVEVLVDTPRVKDLIKKGQVDLLKEAMEQGSGEGCQTFDQALLLLYREGRIDLDRALANADSPNNLRLAIRSEDLKQGKATPDAARFRLEGIPGCNPGPRRS